jgi:hypothetical protein
MFTKNLILAAAVGGFVLTGAAIAADDGESKTLLKNSYQQTSLVGCDSVVACYATFPATTADNTVITAVNCYFFVTSGTQAIFALGTQQSSARLVFQPFFIANTGNLNVGVNATTNLFVTKGDVVFIQVYAVGGTNEQQMTCTISGYRS